MVGPLGDSVENLGAPITYVRDVDGYSKHYFWML
jgi:hypothetical protein